VSRHESMEPRGDAVTHEEEIRGLVARLGRPHTSGGTVIERAALMAAGADFDATVAWILAHGGRPEAGRVTAPRRGLHGSASDGSDASAPENAPRRFVLPAGAVAGSHARDAPVPPGPPPPA
jgi:hypothetical protein